MRIRGLLTSAALLLVLGGIAVAQNFQADSALSVYSVIWPNNTTAVQVCKTACRVYQIDAFNNSTTLAYVKLYNAATAAAGPTTSCGGGTPQWRGMIPYGTSSAGGGFTLPWINGDSYSNGLWLCMTTGIADSDTGAPAATTYLVNIHYKTISEN